MITKNIDAPRLRAARALLEWSVNDLAEKADIHPQTIFKIEKGDNADTTSNPTQRTTEKILTALYRAGVVVTERGAEFIDSVREFKGKDGFLAFKQDVYWTIRNGGNVCVSNVNEEYFVKWAGDEAPAYRELMKSIEKLNFKILIGEGDTNTTAKGYAQYRVDTSKYFRADLPVFIYGNKTAHIVFHADNVDVVIIDNETLTDANRERFMLRWEAASPVE